MSILSYASLECDLSVGFVYLWTNNINGKMYIGSHNGKKWKTYTSSGIGIRRAFKYYGIENFTRTFLYVGPLFREVEGELLEIIDVKNSSLYYNQINSKYAAQTAGNPNGTAGMYGKTQSEETRQKISVARTGVPRVTDWLVGVPRPEESKKKTGQTMLIRWHDKGSHKVLRDGCPKCTLELL